MVMDAVVRCFRGLVAWPAAVELGLVVAVAVIGGSGIQADGFGTVMVEHDMRLNAVQESSHDQDHRERDGLDEAQGSGRTKHASSI